MSTRERPYRGMTAAERLADRRRRLLDAALEIVGTHGYRRATIEEVCALAGVTARNFYEAFPGREELLLALYDDVVAEHMATVAAVNETLEGESVDVVVRASIEASVRAWVADERKARIAFIEIIGVSRRMEDRRFEVLRQYGAWVAANADAMVAAGRLEPRDRSLTGLGIVGAMTQLLADWLHAPAGRPLERVIDEIVVLASAMLRA